MTRILTAALLLMFYVGMANEPGQQKPSLAQQIQSIREQSQFVEPFRMVKAYQVENFWKAVQDTLRENNDALVAVQKRSAGFEGEIAKLQSTITQKEGAVQEMQFAATHISFIGMDIEKAKFIWMVAAILTGLLVLAFLAFLAFRVSLRSAAESRMLYDELSRDFDTYKRNTVEKEVKLYRELQDYRNRLTELKSA
ncbi:MAG TPA: hypothetical protein PLV21_04285 [Cyclobacteriaceae bacterium]|nr:hypothetical protein [Cyclobacteriaceae bacterium]HRJ81079.1 hypothetical protein [Cyclobacteriaceae bacterium]